MADFITGLRYALSGFTLLTRSGIRLYALLPLLINLVLFVLAITYGTSQFNALLNRLTEQWAWLEWLGWLLWPLFLLLMLGFVFFCFSILANILAAPLNGYLSTAVERHLGASGTNLTPTTRFTQQIQAGLRSEMVKMRFFFVRGLPLLLLFVIPIVQLLAPVVWFIYAAWMIALEYLEIPLGNRGLLFPQVVGIAGQNRRLLLGFGTGVLLMTMMPGINLMIMPVAISGATKLALEKLTA